MTKQSLGTAAEQYQSFKRTFYQALQKLRFAHSHFDPSSLAALPQTGPRLRSVLERAPALPRPLPVPSNYGIPPSALSVGSHIGLSDVLSAGIGIGRTSAPVVYPARVSATAGTVNRSVVEILQGQEMSRSISSASIAPTQQSWRSSIFGTGKGIWS